MSNTPSSDAILFVHAHPDDECILTGATLAKAASLGIRTIVVYGSRGDAGETNTDLAGECLGDRRVREAEAACAALGVSRVEWLPYADSGMADSSTTENPDAFSKQSPESVAVELAELLAGDPPIAVEPYREHEIHLNPMTLAQGEEAVVLSRLLEILAAARGGRPG